MSDFSVLISPPTNEEQLAEFWANAPATLSPLTVASESMVNQTIQTFLSGSNSLWNALVEIGVNLTDIRNATGGYLTLLAKGFYDIDRTLSLPTIGRVYVSAPSSLPNGTTVTFQNSATGIQYSGTWNASPSIAAWVTLTASSDGPNGNCSIASLVSLSPSSYTVDGSGVNPTGRAWIIQQGSNEEADGHLIQRCLDVVALQSTGGSDNIAAQIRTATNGNVWRVYCPRGSSTVYVAGQNGPANASFESVCLLMASKYSRASTTPNIIGCATPIALQTLSVAGTLSFPPGTPTEVVQRVTQGLQDWINSLPIRSGEGQDDLTMAVLIREIFALDTTDQVIPDIWASTAGWTYTKTTDVFASVKGAILVADLSNLSVVFR